MKAGEADRIHTSLDSFEKRYLPKYHIEKNLEVASINPDYGSRFAKLLFASISG